jgi:hypothetical protein
MEALMKPNDNPHTYAPPGPDDDFVLWAETQAALLRARQFGLLDIDNLVEEIEGMARSDHHRMRTRLEVLMAHLLKFSCQPGHRSRSWTNTIREQRRRLRRLLSASPSLRRKLSAMAVDAYPDAIDSAMKQTGLPASAFPPECPYSAEQLLDYQYLPANSSLPRSA